METHDHRTYHTYCPWIIVEKVKEKGRRARPRPGRFEQADPGLDRPGRQPDVDEVERSGGKDVVISLMPLSSVDGSRTRTAGRTSLRRTRS